MYRILCLHRNDKNYHKKILKQMNTEQNEISTYPLEMMQTSINK